MKIKRIITKNKKKIMLASLAIMIVATGTFANICLQEEKNRNSNTFIAVSTKEIENNIDIPKEHYSYEPYVWARANGLVDKMTHEELDSAISVWETLYMLWKFKGSPNEEGKDYDISYIKEDVLKLNNDENLFKEV